LEKQGILSRPDATTMKGPISTVLPKSIAVDSFISEEDFRRAIDVKTLNFNDLTSKSSRGMSPPLCPIFNAMPPVM
jgi:hypothetical protein